MRVYFSKVLNQEYLIKDGILKFKDQTKYNAIEVRKINGLNDDSLRTVHKVKKVFQGLII